MNLGILQVAAPRLAASQAIIQSIRDALEGAMPVSINKLLLLLLARIGAVSQAFLDADRGEECPQLFDAKVDVFILSICLQLHAKAETGAQSEAMLAQQLAQLLDSSNQRYRAAGQALPSVTGVAENLGQLLTQLMSVRAKLRPRTQLELHIAALCLLLSPTHDDVDTAVADDEAGAAGQLARIQNAVTGRLHTGWLSRITKAAD